MYLAANVFLHVAYKTTRDQLTDELLDVLFTTCLQSSDRRRCLNARQSSVLSLSRAAKLIKVVANNSRNTVQLIEIELSKAYLHRALRCKDSDSDSIYCLANVYLAVLYYTTGQYQTAIDHCALVMRSEDHSQCSSHVVQGEFLPKIDDNVDSVLGLATLYHYVRSAAFSQQHQHHHVSVFTTELFAHYLHIKCLSVGNSHQRTSQPSLSAGDKLIQRYQKCFREFKDMLITDVLLYHLENGQRQDPTKTVAAHRSETSRELVELLQQSAVEHLTKFRHFEAEQFECVTTDFEALYAYKCGKYQRCLDLSRCNVRKVIGCHTVQISGRPSMFACPEFIQLMDDDIVSAIGLVLLVNPSCRRDLLCAAVNQLSLSLYLVSQCQMKLHHPVMYLAQSLDYVEVARRSHCHDHTRTLLDQVLLKLTEQRILTYISTRL